MFLECCCLLAFTLHSGYSDYVVYVEGWRGWKKSRKGGSVFRWPRNGKPQIDRIFTTGENNTEENNCGSTRALVVPIRKATPPCECTKRYLFQGSYWSWRWVISLKNKWLMLMSFTLIKVKIPWFRQSFPHGHGQCGAFWSLWEKPCEKAIYHSNMSKSRNTHDGSMVLLYISIYGAPWIPSIYPSHVSIEKPAPAGSVMGYQRW